VGWYAPGGHHHEGGNGRHAVEEGVASLVGGEVDEDAGDPWGDDGLLPVDAPCPGWVVT
jgi:hypothetical protein